MKVDKIIYSCDGTYHFLWKHVSEITKKVLNITPVLFYINLHEETDFQEDEFGLVKKIKVSNTDDSVLLGQIFRLYGTKYFPDEVCLLSDLDMILFNKNWLENNLKDIHSDELALLNGDAYDNRRSECQGQETRYPMCYYVGKGKTFNKIVNTDRTWKEFAEEVSSTKRGYDNDEIFFTQKLIKGNHGINYHPKKRGYSSVYYAPGRIEKYMFEDNSNCPGNHMHKLNLKGTIDFDTFIDCHIWRGGEKILIKLKKELIDFYS